MDAKDMLDLKLEGHTYEAIAKIAGVSRQRIQQLLSPPTAIRDIVVKRYSGKCADCGLLVGSRGHVHHKGSNDRDRYNDIENLELLCLSCHRMKHPRIITSKWVQFDKSQGTYSMSTAIEQLTCARCGHSWYPQRPAPPPKVCPRCKTYDWSQPKKGQ